MNSNQKRGVAYNSPGKVAVESIVFPEPALGERKCHHAVIPKVITAI